MPLFNKSCYLAFIFYLFRTKVNVCGIGIRAVRTWLSINCIRMLIVVRSLKQNLLIYVDKFLGHTSEVRKIPPARHGCWSKRAVIEIRFFVRNVEGFGKHLIEQSVIELRHWSGSCSRRGCRGTTSWSQISQYFNVPLGFWDECCTLFFRTDVELKLSCLKWK